MSSSTLPKKEWSVDKESRKFRWVVNSDGKPCRVYQKKKGGRIWSSWKKKWSVDESWADCGREECVRCDSFPFCDFECRKCRKCHHWPGCCTEPESPCCPKSGESFEESTSPEECDSPERERKCRCECESPRRRKRCCQMGPTGPTGPASGPTGP